MILYPHPTCLIIIINCILSSQLNHSNVWKKGCLQQNNFNETAKLICAFVFLYAKWWLSHDAAT